MFFFLFPIPEISICITTFFKPVSKNFKPEELFKKIQKLY